MHAEDRLIHFSTELIHAPRQLKVPALQKLYYELSQTRASYDSTDFTAPNQFRFYSKRGPKTQSIALFMPDRIVLIEEWVDMALSDFLEKLKEVAVRAMHILGIPELLGQTATLRSTFILSNFEDARVFLMDHACGQANRIGVHFKRPIAVGGLRYVLPETPDHPGSLHVIIESFLHNPKEVFVEVKGIFGNQHIDNENLPLVVDNIKTVRAFISENVFPYLNQFDYPVGDMT